MDINKFKSVAVRKADYDTLQGLCNQKFRSPASMISKLVNQYVEYQALKNKMDIVDYKKHILKMDPKLIVIKENNVRTVEDRVKKNGRATSVKRRITRKIKRRK